MNIVDYILLICVTILIFFAVRFWFRHRGSCNGCCGNCSSCQGHCTKPEEICCLEEKNKQD